MAAACEDILGATQRKQFVGHGELWEIRKARIHAMVERLLLVEAQHGGFSGGTPAAFEAEFGEGKPWPALRVPAPAGEGEVFLRGKIDRVNVGAAELAVIDYKTGRRQAHDGALKDGERLRTAFQLPIYAAAARHGLGRMDAAVDALFVSVREASPTRSLRERAAEEGALVADVLALGGEELASAREHGTRALGDAVWELVTRMREGRFEVHPTDCEHCPIETACRVVHLERDDEDSR